MRPGRAVITLGLLLFFSYPVFAQDRTPWLEVGPLFTCLTGCADLGNKGFGGRATVNITKVIGAEFQMARLEKRSENEFIDPRTYGSGNAKLTFLRLEDRLKFNVFGIGGLGFMKHQEFVGKSPGPITRQDFTSPAITFGGGFEIVPQRFVSIRFDFADFSSRSDCLDFGCDQIGYNHDLDLKLGIMLRLP